MNKKFFSGDSIRHAVLQAARYFKVDPDEVSYREVDRRHGFLRSRRRAVIEVSTENPTRPVSEGASVDAASVEEQPVPSEPSPAPEPARQPWQSDAEPVSVEGAEAEPSAEPEVSSEPERSAEPEPRAAARTEPRTESRPFQEFSEQPVPLTKRYPRAEGDLAEAAQTALGRIFELGRVDLEAEVLQGEERLEVELSGADEELLLEDRGRLLLAIQHLLPRMLRGLTGQSTPCWVDCDNFHEIRTEQLRDLAQRVATEVRNSGRSRMLEPMSPDERRIVHLTLADDPAVETVSQGNGLFKRVQVRPQKLSPRGFDPYTR